MLRCFAEKGYCVEWRVINAADYGFPQRRRRIYIFAYHKSTKHFSVMSKINPKDIIGKYGLFAKEFPIFEFENQNVEVYNCNEKYKDLVSVSNKFQASFFNSGFMVDGHIYTVKTIPCVNKNFKLKKIIEENVDTHYFLNEQEIKKFEYLRGNKKIPRIDKNTGHEYVYSEGAMSPYDSLELPARTMLTSEGTVNRSTHVIMDPQYNKLRILTPVECERINQFPDNWTNTGMPEKRRYFMMGNALVCGIINKLGNSIETIIEKE